MLFTSIPESTNVIRKNDENGNKTLTIGGLKRIKISVLYRYKWIHIYV